MIKITVLKMKYRKILKEMESIHINEKAFFQYKFDVRNNAEVSDKQLETKLKRNYILGKKVNDYKVRYGNLNIYHTGNTITNVVNNRGRQIKTKIDEKLKNDLNIILGL